MVEEDTSECDGNQNDQSRTKVSEVPENYSRNVCGTENGAFSAEEFVQTLLNEASKIPCDETLKEFNDDKLPEYYDADKCKRAQEFFEENKFASFFGMLLGLVVVLYSPKILDILRLTKRSGCVMTAYRRYWATVLHIHAWHEEELSPNKKSMKSMSQVKSMHNSASKMARLKGIPSITQKDMAITQFSFVGFPLTRANLIGLHKATDEDLESLVHFWRVIGSFLGIQDRFNICRNSVEETRQICEVLIEKIFLPVIEQKDEIFLEMTSYIVDGLWYANPVLNYRVVMSYLYDIMKPNKTNEQMYFDLTTAEKLHYKFIAAVFSHLKYSFVRSFVNFMYALTMWSMSIFPFLAIVKFGYQKAMVSIGAYSKTEHVS